jgi:DNA-binding MarR family transcriptional regulator
VAAYGEIEAERSEMDKPTDLIEYESMLLGRHVHMTARAKQTSGNLERSAYILLSRLRVQGPMSIGELSDAFDLDHSTLNRQTAALLREDLVDRIPDPAGGMARKFRITAEGRRRLELARTEIVAGLENLLSDWSAEDIETFAGYMRRFNAEIERVSGKPWPRPR